jgi:hypothetical protein
LRLSSLFNKEPSPPVKMRTTIVAILCVLAPAIVAQGQQTPPLAPPRAGFSFPQKQTLTYSVDWRVFPAGTAVIRFEAAGNRENITASADTSGAINLLFHVSDRFQSSFDRSRGCTDDFNKQTVEGRRQISSTLHLDTASTAPSWTKRTWSPSRTSTSNQPYPAASLTCSRASSMPRRSPSSWDTAS